MRALNKLSLRQHSTGGPKENLSQRCVECLISGHLEATLGRMAPCHPGLRGDEKASDGTLTPSELGFVERF